MTRTPEPLYIADISQFTKSLRAALAEEAEAPSHLRLMGLVSQAAGYRNTQTRKAKAQAEGPARLTPQAQKALRAFDGYGRLARWPNQYQLQVLCLWVIWHYLPARQDIDEPTLNRHLKARHTFGDHALLKRSLVDHGLMTRSKDGRVNRRVEMRPPEDVHALFHATLPKSWPPADATAAEAAAP